MRNMRKISRGVWSALLTLCGLSVLVLTAPHETLMRQTTRITAWEPRQEATWQNDDSYWWLSDHELLFVSVQRASENPKDYTVVRYDTRTGTRTHLSALEQEMFAHRGNMHTSGWQVSPDGTSLLWNGSDRVPASDTATGQSITTLKESWYVTFLEGGPTQTWPRETSDNPYTFWLPDSRHWLEWHDSHGANRFPAQVDIHSLGKSAVTSLNSDMSAGYYMNIGMTGPMSGLSVSPHVGDGDVSLMRWTINPDFVPQAGKFLPTPGKSGPLEAVVSPQGNRVAWKFFTTPGPYFLSGTRFMRHLNSSAAGLYVSQSDGSDMRLIGTFNSPPNARIHLRWTPDGRRLSFAYHGNLYTVPAP